MPTIIEFTVPAGTFHLDEIFQSFPDMEVEFERAVPTNHTILPYFWIWGDNVEAIPAHFTGNSTSSAIEFIDTVPGGGLFRGDWRLNNESILRGIKETELTLLSAIGTRTGWEFQLRSADTNGVTQFQQYCRKHSIPLTVTRLYTLSELRTGDQYQITTAQEEALIAAFEAGYFNQPRETKLEGIAQELGISRQSLAERLRRGHCNLIANTLMHRSE